MINCPIKWAIPTHGTRILQDWKDYVNGSEWAKSQIGQLCVNILGILAGIQGKQSLR